MRESMREEDPRTRAARRAAELRDHGGLDDDSYKDDFYIDPALIPPGWTYEWKRILVAGAADPGYEVQIARAGFEPVPVSRHPEMMPMNWKGMTIERSGLLLMERPAEITQIARERELRIARAQVQQKEAQLNSAEPGHFERANKDQPLVRINKSYESIPIPE